VIWPRSTAARYNAGSARNELCAASVISIAPMTSTPFALLASRETQESALKIPEPMTAA